MTLGLCSWPLRYIYMAFVDLIKVYGFCWLDYGIWSLLTSLWLCLPSLLIHIWYMAFVDLIKTLSTKSTNTVSLLSSVLFYIKRLYGWFGMGSRGWQPWLSYSPWSLSSLFFLFSFLYLTWVGLLFLSTGRNKTQETLPSQQSNTYQISSLNHWSKWCKGVHQMYSSPH